MTKHFPVLFVRLALGSCSHSDDNAGNQRSGGAVERVRLFKADFKKAKQFDGDVQICDDNFLANRKRVDKILDAIEERGLKGLVLRCGQGIRADLLTREMLVKMKRAGFKHLGIGVESADDHILKVIKKNETLEEIERFIAAMVAIREEIRRVERGEWPQDDNPLKNAPHTAGALLKGEWPHPYPRDVGAAVLDERRHAKYWPPVGRVDNVYGDRNLFCSCVPMSAYE